MNCKDCLGNYLGYCKLDCLCPEKCENFQARSLWVKLPCKAGDKVYVIYNGYVTFAYVLAFYIDKDGGMFDLCIKTKEEYAVDFKKVIDKSYTFSDIFLTREDAERALKECENDEQKNP